MESNTWMFKSSPLVFLPVRNGLIAGTLGFVLIVILYFIGRHPFLFPVYYDFRIALLGVFLVTTVKELRDAYQQGEMSFAQAMVSAFLLTTVFAITASVLLLVFGWVMPAFVSDYVTLATRQMKSIEGAMIEQFGKELYEQSLAELPTTRIFDLALDYFVKSFVISFFISIIISVILRRQPKTS
jgi:hypothetical protein